MRIDNNQLLLILVPLCENLVRQEFLQALPDLAVLQRGDIFYGSRSGCKPMQRFQF